MKKSEIKVIQKLLSQKHLYSGAIDGISGKNTLKGINKALAERGTELPEHWSRWSKKRKSVAFLQLSCRDNEIDSGKVDGLYGPQTETASELLISLVNTGSLPRSFSDISPVNVNPHEYPMEGYDSLVDFYGPPCEANIVRVPCPWPLRLDWALTQKTHNISIHESLSDSLGNVLQQVFEIYQLQGIKELGLDRYGGSFNCRKKRGSQSSWSTHAWGIAIDWFPSRNKLRWDSTKASLAHTDLDDWWAVWEQQGWLSLGRREDRDWMHVQAAKR